MADTKPTPKYPQYVNRHTASGDTNPPTRSPGAPTDPSAPSIDRRRVFLGRTAVLGFPLIPLNARYPDGTELTGRGEEVTSDVANRVGYGLWRTIDSIAERPRLPLKHLRNQGAPVQNKTYVETKDLDPTGGGSPIPLSNDHLIYLGPLAEDDPEKYIVYTVFGSRGKADQGNGYVEVDDVLTDLLPGGVSLYPPGTPIPVAGFFPEGNPGTLQTVVTTDITCDGAVTTGDALKGHCLYNYSLSTRISRSAPMDLWKAFAIVVDQSGGPGNPATLNHDVQADGWAAGDIVYYTDIALAPVLQMSGSVSFFPGYGAILSAGWDRVMNGRNEEQVRSFIEVARTYPLPCLEIALPFAMPIFALDYHNAMFRARMDDLAGHLIGYMSIDEEADLANQAFASFMHAQVKEFNNPGVTVLSPTPSNQFVLGAPNVLTLFGGAQWSDGAAFPNTVTDLLLGHDLVEVYEELGGGFPSPPVPGRKLGLWWVTGVAPGTGQDATVIRIDGDATGAGLPGIGILRILRPVFWDSGVPTPLAPGQGTHMVSRLEGGTPFPALHIVALDDVNPVFIQTRKDPIGSQTAKSWITGHGHFTAAEFDYITPHTFYHQISLPSGLPLVGISGLPSIDWSYNAPPIASPEGIWYINNPGPLAGEPLLVFPVHLPHGSTVLEFSVQYNCLALPGVPPSAYLFRKPRTNANAWLAGSTVAWEPINTLRTIPAMPNVVGPANYYVYADATPGPDDLINNELHEYFAVVVASDVGLDRLHGIRISFAQPTVAPA